MFNFKDGAIGDFGQESANNHKKYGRYANIEQQFFVQTFFEQENLAHIAGEMKNGRHSEHRIKIKIKVPQGHEEDGRTKASNGPDDFGDQCQQQKSIVDFHTAER